MIKKKIVFGLFVVTFFSGCAAPTAMIGPAYTLGSTGNVLQTGFSYGSSKLVKSYTGKTTVENLKDVASSVQSKNIKKQTLVLAAPRQVLQDVSTGQRGAHTPRGVHFPRPR